MTIVDLAAGTGKLTRLLLPFGDVVAVEPVAEMRAHLASIAPAVGATAESLPLRDGSVDALTVGQAFHWFDAPVALTEIARVLRPGGRLALLWNDRDNRVPWVEAVTAAIHACDPGTAYDKDIDWVAVVAASGRFTPVEVADHEHDHPMDVELVVDRAMSTSYVAAGPEAQRVALAETIREILAGFDGTFAFPHVTTAYSCTRS
jgi:SAM-dependent methyltransferase